MDRCHHAPAALGPEARIQLNPRVRERALWQITEMSYPKTAVTLAELRRLPVGHGEIHRRVARESARIERRSRPPSGKSSTAQARLGKQRGSKVARVEVARELATAIWDMLTKNEPFAPGRSPASALVA